MNYNKEVLNVIGKFGGVTALKDALGGPGVSVIEIPIDRDRSVAHHREIERRVCEALASEAGGS